MRFKRENLHVNLIEENNEWIVAKKEIVHDLDNNKKLYYLGLTGVQFSFDYTLEVTEQIFNEIKEYDTVKYTIKIGEKK